MSFERKVVWRPAFDKRAPEPSKNYGVHGLEIQFQLIGPEGGVTFTIFTNWMLPHVQAEVDARPIKHPYPFLFHKPQPAGCDGHWKRPTYPEQSKIEDCAVTGGDCYCDGTSITEDIFDALVSEGDAAVWRILEERYESWKPKDAAND